MTTKDIMNIIPTIQSVGLVNENLKFLKKKKKKTKDYVYNFGTNIVGTSLIKSQADFIAGI
jgi:hypothetical protein